MNTRKSICCSLLIFCCFHATAIRAEQSIHYGDHSASPVSFLQNKGQWPENILFRGNSTSTHVYLLRDGLSFAQISSQSQSTKQYNDPAFHVWNMKFLNHNDSVNIYGENGKASVLSYLSGNDPSKWVIHPEQFRIVHYKNVYDNIDLSFYGSGNDLKYDYVMHPGGNLNAIRASYEGIQQLSVNAAGELVIRTDHSTQLQRRPVAWQEISGVRHMVDVQYSMLNDTTFGFVVLNGFNKKYDLVIDPLFQMVWSSYTLATGGSNNINYCFSNAMDQDGNVYLTGMVDGTFPTTPGAYSGPGNVSPEIFVAKFSSDGTTMLYGTYLPANSSEHGSDIAVDDLGRAYITGIVDLNFTGITNYPSTPNAYQPVHNSGSDAIMTVLNPTGTGLVYSSFLGGTGSETGYGIALGGPGIAYITGSTSIGNFPVVASTAFPSGDNDVFVAKFDINQSGVNSLVYATRIGAGSFSICHGRSIAVNNAGNVFVTGTIFSSFGSPTFPITAGAYNNVFNTGQDGVMTFVTKLSATTPVTLSYSTFLVPGTGNSIAVDAATDDAYIVGSTFTFAFPVTSGALQPVHAGNNGTDAFAIRLNAAGNALVYSTFLGGPFADVGTGVAINSMGEAYVVGISQDSFPTSAGAYQPDNAGTYDFFIVNLNAGGTGYGCGGSTYVGGSDADYSGSFYDYASPHVSIRDHSGINDTICVSSTSHSQDFPTTPGVYGPVKVNGIADQPVFFKMTCFTAGAPPIANFSSAINTSCNSASVNFTDLTAGNPTSYQWSFPGAVPASSTSQNPQGIVYSSSGIYNVTLVACNQFGCDSSTTTIQLTIPQNIPVSLGNDTTICNGNTIILNATPGQQGYSWQFNGNSIGGNQASLTASQQGLYSVIVTDSLGCTGTDTVLIMINAPVVDIGPNVTLCNNDSILITATPGFSNYQWTINGVASGTNTNTIYISQTGIHSVMVADTLGCTATDTILVTINNPAVAIGPDVVLCNNDSVLVTATAGFSSYQWLLNGMITGSVSNTIYASQQGSFVVIIQDSIGCIASDSLIAILSTISITLPDDTAFCAGNNLILDAGPGFTGYDWQLNGNSISTASSVTVTQTGNYFLTVTNADGCDANDSITVTVNSLPDVQTINDVTVCAGQSVTLTTQGALSYSWSPATYLSSAVISNPVCLPVADISYVVTGTDINGCVNTDQVNILVIDLPQASFDYSLAYTCNGIVLSTENNSLNATNYEWLFGDGNTSNDENPQHYYSTLQNQTIQLVASNGICSDTVSVVNVSFEIPLFDSIPNVFTPNGDGKNDCFSIPGVEQLSDCFEMDVFNRWGNLVYESGDSEKCWNGSGKDNVELPEGVYFYIISISNSKFKGTLQLIR